MAERNELGKLLDWYANAQTEIERLTKLITEAWYQFIKNNSGSPKSICKLLDSLNITNLRITDELLHNGIFCEGANLAYSQTPYIDPALIKNTDEIEAISRQLTQGNSSYVEITIRLKQHPNLLKS